MLLNQNLPTQTFPSHNLPQKSNPLLPGQVVGVSILN